MSNRDFGFSVLGRFLAVECYRESHQPFSTSPPRTPGADRTRGYANKPDSRCGSQAPARPQQG
jgi:hypothetical protein